MRILHTICSVDPKDGGTVESVRQLGCSAASDGHSVEVLSLDPPGESFVTSFPLPVHALGPSRLKYGYTPRLIPWLRKNASLYDVVVVNGIWQYHSFGTRQGLRNTKTPYVVYPHGMLGPWVKRRYPAKHIKKWLYWPWGDYRVLRDAAAVLFTCDEERRLARQSFSLYRANENVVSLGTICRSDADQTSSEAFFLRFPETRGKRLLLFMGSLDPRKACDLVIKAFTSVLATDSRWHLVLAGPDPLDWKAQLVRLTKESNIHDRVTWTGFIGGNMKSGALQSAEALFLPSHQENFGIVIAEALACGVPALISNRVNIWREIEDDGAGFVEDDTEQGACTLLRRWIDAPQSSRDAMRIAAKNSFSRRFDIRKASDNLISALRSVIREAASS